MSTRPAASKTAAAATCSTSDAGSGAVIGVDPNVVIGEVAGPNRGLRFAATKQNANAQLVLGHTLGRDLFRVIRGAAPALGDAQIVDEKLHALHVQIRDAGPPHSGQN